MSLKIINLHNYQSYSSAVHSLQPFHTLTHNPLCVQVPPIHVERALIGSASQSTRMASADWSSRCHSVVSRRRVPHGAPDMTCPSGRKTVSTVESMLHSSTLKLELSSFTIKYHNLFMLFELLDNISRTR